jgi:dihydroorotate dehydrogenase
MRLLDTIGRPFARLLPAELAHTATIKALARLPHAPAPPDDPALKTVVGGLTLPNPVGLAAGFDKNGEVPDAMLAAGFGFVECGTVTPKPQAGNAKPRLFRLVPDEAVINRMGFNNDGLTVFVNRLRARSERPGVVGANVGANKDATDRIGDYAEGVRRVWLHTAYVTINISSPNTPGLRALQTRNALEELLGRVSEARQVQARAHGDRPVFLKIAPDLDADEIEAIVEASINGGINALIVSNTTLDRPDTLQSALASQAGGLSGRPLFDKSTRILREVSAAAAGRIDLIGVGGIGSPEDAVAKLAAGAKAVQLYTALVYRGLGLVGRIKAAILEARRHGVLQ